MQPLDPLKIFIRSLNCTIILAAIPLPAPSFSQRSLHSCTSDLQLPLLLLVETLKCFVLSQTVASQNPRATTEGKTLTLT